MRDLRCNARDLWYANFSGIVEQQDENGDWTGEKAAVFSAPVHFRANVSATRGTQGFTGTGSSYDYFGADVKYDLIISTAQMNLPINEYTLIWEEQPTYEANRYGISTDEDSTRVLADVDDAWLEALHTVNIYPEAKYRVKAVARGLHHMKYAIQTLQRSVAE